MSRPTFQDWAMWGLVGSIEDCAEDTRDRMRLFVQAGLASVIAKWPQYKGQFREFLGGPADTEAERMACRKRCAGCFDEHMNRTRKKPWLFSRRPKTEPPAHEDYAAKWSKSAAWIIRTMFNEDILPFIQKAESLDDENDDGVSKGANIGSSQFSPDEEAMLADDQAVLRPRLLRLELSDRERLVLWAIYNQKNICGKEMQTLSGVGREQCSQCKIRLQERLRQEVIQMFHPELMPVALIETLTDWAMWTLAEFHSGVYPTRGADGAIVWRDVTTHAIFVIFRPEMPADGPFLWIEATALPMT